jgi:hypothetical protein
MRPAVSRILCKRPFGFFFESLRSSKTSVAGPVEMCGISRLLRDFQGSVERVGSRVLAFQAFHQIRHLSPSAGVITRRTCSSEWQSSRHIRAIRDDTQGTRFQRCKEEQRNDHPDPSSPIGGEDCWVGHRLVVREPLVSSDRGADGHRIHRDQALETAEI